jgi:DNA-binding MarR family transcriptional regulator
MISREIKMSSETSVEDWELLAQVCQAYRSLSDAFMDQIEMHRAQATLLCRLFVQEGMTQSEIADQLSVQGATVTNMLQRMEEAGLVTRQRDVEDNRLVRVYLTDAGRSKERSIVEQFVKVEETMFEGLTQEDRASLRRMLRLVLNNMNKGG